MRKIVWMASVAYLGVSAALVSANVVSVTPTAGTDSTGAVAASFTVGDLAKLALSDDVRVSSNGNWPMIGAYDESRYLDFVFTANIPAGATINSVVVTHEYRRNAVLTGVKLEDWNGATFFSHTMLIPPNSSDIVQTLDLTSEINSVGKVNGLDVRFLAYRDTVVASATTSHDQVFLTVDYTPAPEPGAVIMALLSFALFFQRSR